MLNTSIAESDIVNQKLDEVQKHGQPGQEDVGEEMLFAGADIARQEDIRNILLQ